MQIEAVGETVIRVSDPKTQVLKQEVPVGQLSKIVCSGTHLSIEFRPEHGGRIVDISLEPEDQVSFRGKVDVLNVYSSKKGEVTHQLLFIDNKPFGGFPPGTFS